jgi:hypothetical protein
MKNEILIIEKFVNAQNRLVLQSSDLSLDAIARMVENGAIDVSPIYQRRDRWTGQKQSALIESFLLNIPVPPIYLAEDRYGKYSAIDGKQRVTAINSFILHGLRLSDLEFYKELEGCSFDDLPIDLKNALTIRPYLRVVTLLKQSDPNLKYEVFTRLNTGGDPLLPQEIRNVVYRGPLNDLVYRLGENSFLKRQLKILTNSSKAYKEMQDAEYVLRFFTLQEYWKQFPGNIRQAMDLFMSENHDSPQSRILALEKSFERSMKYAELIWGNTAFFRPNGNNQVVQGFYDIHTVPFSFFNDKKLDVLVERKTKFKNMFLRRYREDDVFNESIRQFTSNPNNVRYRIETMSEIIQDIIQ